MPSSSPEDYEVRADIFNLADMIFRFFFPSTLETSMASKFWGAVKNQVKVYFNLTLCLISKEQDADGYSSSMMMRG